MNRIQRLRAWLDIKLFVLYHEMAWSGDSFEDYRAFVVCGILFAVFHEVTWWTWFSPIARAVWLGFTAGFGLWFMVDIRKYTDLEERLFRQGLKRYLHR